MTINELIELIITQIMKKAMLSKKEARDALIRHLIERKYEEEEAQCKNVWN
jgi:hypothetical protein